MLVFVPKNADADESRIAIMPATVKKYCQLGFDIAVQAGIGQSLSISDAAFADAGAKIIQEFSEITAPIDISIGLNLPEKSLVNKFPQNTWHISFFNPFQRPELLTELAEQHINLISLELLPRSTLAQPMDALSSQANLAGYASVLQACEYSEKVLPMMMTAAGTIAPAKVFVIGVGVAGLQAIATAKRLGAQVIAYDVRPAVEEQVKSLGAQFLKIDLGAMEQTKQGYAKALTIEQLAQQQQMMTKACANADIIITTALVFGKTAPQLITLAMLEQISSGTVIVDLATKAGGNVAKAQKDQVIDYNGIKIIGFSELSRYVARDASELYANNIFNLIKYFYQPEEKQMQWNLQDEILQSACLTFAGKIIHQEFNGA
ncbi:MAG: NAD(P) transhydrogenase subunit alpha [Pseudomonadota bacterium]